MQTSALITALWLLAGTKGAPPAKPPAPTCIEKDAELESAQVTDQGVTVCFARECWAVDTNRKTWTFLPGVLSVQPAAPANPTASELVDPTHLRLCVPTQADCRTIALPDLHLSDDYNHARVEPIGVDQFAVWDSSAVRVFDAHTGQPQATIKGWVPEDREKSSYVPEIQVVNALLSPGDDPVLAVMVSHSPISWKAKLFSAKTGQPLGLIGKDMDDDMGESASFFAGPHAWAFPDFYLGKLFVHDVRTGQLVHAIDFVAPGMRKKIMERHNATMGVLVAKLRIDLPTAVFVPALPGYTPIATVHLKTGARSPIPTPLCR